MKKATILVTFVMVITGITLLAIAIREKSKTKELFYQKLAIIPQIDLYDLNSNLVKLNNIGLKEKVIIIYFDTNCDICQIEAKEFYNFQDKFKDSDVVFISNNTIDETKRFIIENRLEESNYLFLSDSNYLLIKDYHIQTIPYILLYINNYLVKTYKGGVSIKQIIKDKNDK